MLNALHDYACKGIKQTQRQTLLLVFLNDVTSKKCCARWTSLNLPHHFIVFHLGFGLTIFCVHIKLFRAKIFRWVNLFSAKDPILKQTKSVIDLTYHCITCTSNRKRQTEKANLVLRLSGSFKQKSPSMIASWTLM